MTSINTNVGALNARASAISATHKMEKAMERLSSGIRVNSAADDAAGLRRCRQNGIPTSWHQHVHSKRSRWCWLDPNRRVRVE